MQPEFTRWGDQHIGNPLGRLRVFFAKAEKGTQKQRKDVEWVVIDAQTTLEA